jgi:ElaB/YqjD/DUF883 family membrane-anchored ribosome-binding protein
VSGISETTQAAGQTAENVAGRLQNIGAQVKDAAQERYAQMRDKTSEFYHQGRDKAVEWERSLENYVREQPMKSVLIAAGIGCLLALVWRLRR